MLERVRDIIGDNRGLALAIRENDLIGFYKIWVDYRGNIIGNVSDFHKESSIIVKGDYDETYLNVEEILVESSIYEFYQELDEKDILELIDDKDLNNISKKQLYKGYTDFVLSNSLYKLFVY